jgi:quercetin dioxygenase-like cupin family protein
MIRNFLDTPGRKRSVHHGKGTVHNVQLFGKEDFDTRLRYIAFTKIPPGASIGFHDHPNEREEVYTILQGTGLFTLNSDQQRVKTGDVIVTKPGCSHGLENDASEPLGVFVFWVER